MTVKAVSSATPFSTPVENTFIMSRIVLLVASLLAQQNRVKASERLQTDEQKKTIKKLNQQSADLNVSMGNTPFWSTMASIAMLTASQTLNSDLMRYFAEHGCQAVSGAINGRYGAQQKQADSASALEQTELQNKLNNSQSNTNQELTGLVGQITELQRRASAS